MNFLIGYDPFSIIGFIFRAMGCMVFLFGVIPLQYQEVKIKDGIILLRFIILFCTAIFVLMQSAGLPLLYLDPVYTQLVLENSYVSYLAFMNGLGFLAISIAMYIIYRKDYSHLQY